MATASTTTNEIVETIATCPHCGVPIYSRAKDERGLPVPEYICNCRFLAAASAAPFYSRYPTTPPWPSYLPPPNVADFTLT